MKMMSFTRSLVCASFLALVSTGVNAAEKVTLKLAHNLERSHVVHQSFEELAKEVKQLSKGMILAGGIIPAAIVQYFFRKKHK